MSEGFGEGGWREDREVDEWGWMGFMCVSFVLVCVCVCIYRGT